MKSNRFRDAKQFSNELALVQEPNERGKWGYVDTSLNLVIPYRFDWAGSFGSSGFDEGYPWGKFDLDDDNRERNPAVDFGPSIVIDKHGRQVSRQYGFMLIDSALVYGVTLVNDGTDFRSTPGFYTYAADGYWGGIDGKGREVIPCKYEFLIGYGKVIMVREKGKWGVISHKGKTIMPAQYIGVIYREDSSRIFNSFLDIDGEEKYTDVATSDDTLYLIIEGGDVGKIVYSQNH